MIAVDTSALMAIVLGEPEADDCARVLEREAVIISAGTLSEALIVAMGRNLLAEMNTLIDGLDVEVVPVTAASARRVAEAYGYWGKGHHPAGLNFGDCFAYEVAKQQGCPLLFVGGDFAQTDLESALPAE